MRPPETGASVLFPVLFFPCFRSCYSPVQRSRLFLRDFNSFSCIRRTSAPCKSPVFYRGRVSRVWTGLDLSVALHLIGAASRPKAQCRQGHRRCRGILALFCSAAKTVASSSILQALSVEGQILHRVASLRRRNSSPPGFFIAFIVLRIVFSLIHIVLAPTGFLLLAQ